MTQTQTAGHRAREYETIYILRPDVAKEAARLLGKSGLLEPVSVNDVKLRAPRPVFCALSNAKLAGLGITMPGWQDALRRFLS